MQVHGAHAVTASLVDAMAFRVENCFSYADSFRDHRQLRINGDNVELTLSKQWGSSKDQNGLTHGN